MAKKVGKENESEEISAQTANNETVEGQTMPNEPTAKPLSERLAAPFDPTEIKWKAQAVNGMRALAMCYVDSCTVEDRLDAVFGVDGWQDEYTVLPSGAVMCALRCYMERVAVRKHGASLEPKGYAPNHATREAFSDAFKSAATKFGVGRYLSRIPQQWRDYDTVSKQLKGNGLIPVWALPEGMRPEPEPEPPPTEQDGAATQPEQPQPAKAKIDIDTARGFLHAASLRGTKELAKVWDELTRDQQVCLRKLKDKLKSEAEVVDSVAETFDFQNEMSPSK